MRSTPLPDHAAVRGAVDRFRTALTELIGLRLDGLSVPDQVEVLDAMQAARCQMPIVEHQAINQIVQRATPVQIGKSVKSFLADRLRISPGKPGAGSPMRKCWVRGPR